MAKFSGKGAKFMIKSSGATPTYTEVGQVQEIGDISVTADEIEVTTLDAGDYRDYIQGFKDPGECELTVIFDPGMPDQGSGPDGLIGLFSSGEIRDCAVRWNSSETGGESFGLFSAFIRDFTYNALNPDDPQTITPLFRLKSPITLVDVLPATVAAGQPLTAADAERIAAKAKKDADALQAAADKAMAAAQVKGTDATAALAAAATAAAQAAQLRADECAALQAAALAAQQAATTPPPTTP